MPGTRNGGKMEMKNRFVVAMVLAFVWSFCFQCLTAEEEAGKVAKKMNNMPLIFEETFEKGNADRWQPSDASAWKVVKEGDNCVYSLVKDCEYTPPVRSPNNFSLIKDITVSDFVLEAKVKSTEPEYGHRDICLFFGYQDPSHFYYVHFGSKADANANSIFIVNGEPRISIAETRTEGTKWDDNYHIVRVVRDTKSGKIEVFFDDLKKPVMTTTNKTFTWGRLGVGSFDDTGNFDNVRIWGTVAKPSAK
jgi:hypothetical protein